MQVKKQQLELGVEKWTVSKLEKEYVKAVYCHPSYLTSMQSISCKMPGWMNHKLESRLQEKYLQTQLFRRYHLKGRKQRGTKEPPDEDKRREGKSWLKNQHSKMKIMASSHITSWQTDGKQWKQWQTLFSWVPTSLGMVTEATKLQDACSLEEKL